MASTANSIWAACALSIALVSCGKRIDITDLSNRLSERSTPCVGEYRSEGSAGYRAGGVAPASGAGVPCVVCELGSATK